MVSGICGGTSPHNANVNSTFVYSRRVDVIVIGNVSTVFAA
jgi:hypothetical protein